ncbi:NAD(+)/NADH kinase [Thermosulfuriphilus sp.]
MRRIALVVKQGVRIPREVKRALRDCLSSRGVEILEQAPFEDIEAIVVLGGDGTLLRTAALAYRLNVPLLGINLGRLGFLTEISLDEVYTALDLLAEGSLSIEERMMLLVTADGQEGPPVLNEVAIVKGPLGRIIRLFTRADGSFITTYIGDGLIISTPTGSTAYSLSAGGPIVHPALESIVLTPICPFMLSSRPLILPGDTEIEIRLAAEAEEVVAILDGQYSFPLPPEGVIKIKKAKRPLRLFTSPTRCYFDILRRKLKWGDPTHPED